MGERPLHTRKVAGSIPAGTTIKQQFRSTGCWVRIHHLDPSRRTPANWSVKKAQQEVRAWLGPQAGLVAELAREELADIVRLSTDVDVLRRRIGERVRAAAPALLEVQGCGELTAARIVAEVASVDRFKGEAAFARYAGLAPIPHSSGGSTVRRPPTRHGNRQLNKALHRIAVTQVNHDGPGRDYVQRRLDQGDSRHRALRSLKRRLARVVFNRMKKCRPYHDSRPVPSPKTPWVFTLPLADLDAGRQRRATAQPT